MSKHLSTEQVKQLFGEFDYTELEGGRIWIDPGWVEANIVTVEVPQLAGVTSTGGRVPFHHKGAEQFKNAFAEVERQGLLKYILTWDGSWVARHICWNPRKGLSPHSWGIAFDINVAWNGYGLTPAAEGARGTVRPLVSVFKDHGFCWGGEWKTPDGMHFEICELNPASQYVLLFIDGIEVKGAEVVIRSNGRSYGVLGPMARAMGITDESVITNDDTVPVAAFLKSHGYHVEWTAEGGPKGRILASRAT